MNDRECSFEAFIIAPHGWFESPTKQVAFKEYLVIGSAFHSDFRKMVHLSRRGPSIVVGLCPSSDQQKGRFSSFTAALTLSSMH